MIAPEYFNNHVSVEGEIIVKSVPNDAGFVLVWNPTTKKISRRTHAEIATDLGLVTASNEAFFNRNRIRSETISSVPVSLDAYLPQGGFISSYNTSSWGGSDRPINASYGGYIKFSDGNNDFNNLELYYNNGHNTPDTHRLWFRTKNNLGSTNWFEAYHSGNLNPGDYWEKLTTGFRGINDNDSRNFSFLSDNGSIAKKINTGGLLVSDSYSNETYVPANGIWSRGNIQSNSRVVSSREGFFGAYDYTQTQGVWSIGESFNVNSNGSTTDLGNQYGMAYSYIDVGGSSFANVHQIHFASAGVAQVSIDCNYGRIKGREYQVIGGNSTQFLKADGSLDSVSYAKSSELDYYHNIDFAGSITNGSNTHKNKTWFDYDWAGTGGKGSVINFSGLNGNYSTEIFSDYLSGNAIGVRTRNGDAGVWNDAKWIWHSGNFTQGDINNWNSAFNDQGNYVNKSGDTMTGDLNVPNIKSSNLNGGQVLTTAGTALYVSNQSVSTYLQTNGGLYHSTPAGVYDIWTAQNFDPNNYIPTSHPSYTISNNNINNWLGYVGYSDTRIIKPEHLSTQKLQFGFTSWNNQNNESVYADYLHFGGYQDASGGNQNLIVINKSVFGIRQYQGLFQDTNAYSKFVDYWHSNNFSQQDIDNWNNTFNDQSNYWRKSSTAGYVGINAITPFSVLNNGYAQKVYMGGLLVSDAYQDEGNVPANGAYVKGQIATSSHGNSAEWRTAYNWGDHKEINTGQYLGNTGLYTIDSNTSVNSLPHGIASYFVQADSIYPSYGSLLNIKTYDGGGGTLQLYTPYSNQYGGDFIKYRRYNYGTDVWTEMRGFWDTGHFSLTDISNWNQAFSWGNHANAGYLTQSALNSQLDIYATLNGVQTFANTNTFLQSPVIPDGTINSHAVNLGQLYYNDRTFITDSRGAVRPPSFYDDRFAQWDFQYRDDTQVTGDAWQGVLTVAKWSNFDPSHRQEQLLFTGENLKRRTAIDDDTWGPEKTIWDSGNFTPANFATTSQLNDKVNKSGDTMTGALLIGNTNIGKQRVLHLAEPTLLDSYGFNFYTDTSTGLLTLHGLNNGSSNATPILSANRGNNFVGINKENPASELDVNGYVASNGFIKNNSSDDYFLMGGGGQLTKYSKEDAFVNSGRDFPDGTLITTNIDYSHSEGDSFLLEIKGNMYGGGIPMDTKVQGYIYADTIINQSGYSTYSDLNTIVAMNINGNLCFWFPRLWYWQGFSVKVIATGGGGITTINRVISIDNSPEPAGTKHVKIAIYTLSTQSWVNNQGFLTSANLNGYVTQSSLNTQLGNYATLNGVQTFNNTNTFNQSPVIPNGTIGNHAVNLNQLLDVAPPYYWNYVGQPAITNRRVLREMTWNNYGNGHTIFDISSGTTPWGASKSNVDAEQPWTPSYPTLVGGNGSETYGVRVDSARNSDNLGGISAGNYATQTWVDSNYIPKSHPVFNITQANINSWNAGTGGGSSHNHSNLSYLNNIDQYLGTGQGPQFGSIRLMDSLGYGLLALEEDFIGGEIGLVDLSNDRFYAGRINEYLKYGSSVNDFEGLNIHFDAKLLCIGREIGNDEDKVQLAGDLSVDTIDIYHNSRQLILNPLYNTNGDVRRSRNAHIYIVTRNPVRLPDKPILGQRIEIFNDSDSDIEVTHGNVGTMFKVPAFCKVTGIAANKGFRFDAKPIDTKQYDI